MIQMGKPESDQRIYVMKKEYRLSRVILVVLTLITVLIVFQNEYYIAKRNVGNFFCFSVLLASFPGTLVSRKMIQTGDRIPNILLRILYFIGLLVGSLVIVVLVGVCFAIFLGTMDFTIGQITWIVYFGFAVLVFLIVPYLQTILVLLLRKILQK